MNVSLVEHDRDQTRIVAAESTELELGADAEQLHVETCGPPGQEVVWMGRGRTSLALLERIRRAAQVSAGVLITGETGTGKELVARMLHFLGPRRGGPFVVENCAALPDTLLESELFGFKRGAFTGALQDKEGLVEAARGGTLFLDEICEISLASQAKLLRLLESQEFRRLGETRSRSTETRFVAATNADLRQRVRDGTFRRDLFYRLSVIPISLPSLRERPQEILDLAQHFLNQRGHDASTARINDDARRRLVAYPWPGNARELRNVIEAACALGDGRTLEGRQVAELTRDSLDDPCTRTSSVAWLKGEIERLSCDDLVEALRAARGNKALAARLCGCSRATLYYKMRKFNLASV